MNRNNLGLIIITLLLAMTASIHAAPKDDRPRVPYRSPEASARHMTMAPGFKVNVFAGEPDMQQGIAFCFDSRGRIWVVENGNYETRRRHSESAGNRLAIFEDTDGDGVFDKKKYFSESYTFTSGIAVGHGGIYLGTPPNLLFVPDADGDDIADGEARVLLDGWGIQDRHETLNSFHWGPDGWLYGCHGVYTKSSVGKPGTPKDQRQYIDAGIWRYHPVKDVFEVFAHGLSNPWGMDFDKHGQMFATACVIPHLWHIVQGGYYHRQAGRHQNAYVYDDIKTIRDHVHKSAHGGARFYKADTFGPEWRDRLFMCNIHQHQVLTDYMVPKGSSFIGKHGPDMMSANDPTWVGFSVELGPDGGIYILDWHDSDICGKDVIHGQTGRIYRIMPEGKHEKPDANVAAMSDERIMGLALHQNDWFARKGRLELAHRANTRGLSLDLYQSLERHLNALENTEDRLRILWAMHHAKGLKGLSESRLLQLLDDQDPYLRAWAIRLLCEHRQISSLTLERLAKMASNEVSPTVRLFLASSLQRIPMRFHAERFAIIQGLVSHAEDADDHNLPKMIWYGLEPLVLAHPEKALKIVSQGELPLLANYVARRMTSHQSKDLSKVNREKMRQRRKHDIHRHDEHHDHQHHQNSSAKSEALTATIQKVANDFSILASGVGGVQFLPSFRNRSAVRTHPLNRHKPAVIERSLKLPEDQTAFLKLAVSHHPHGDFELVIRVNGKVVTSSVVSSKSVVDEWLALTINLSDYAGKKIHLAIENKANDWHNEWAYWHRIEVVTEK